MGRNCKYTFKQKLQAVTDYLSGKKSCIQIAAELRINRNGARLIRDWANQYKSQGESALIEAYRNSSYSKEFKEKVVKEYLNGIGSLRDLSNKYGIRDKGTLRRWVLKYNNLEKIEDYNPHPEVYMAERRKTTLDERVEIVKYCLDHEKNYSETASIYKCSYTQVYQWVKKYLEDNKNGLADNRGKRKKEEELTELEAALRRAKKAEEKVKRLEMENEFLKNGMR